MPQPIASVGPFLRLEGQYGAAFFRPSDIARVLSGQQGDALLFFFDGKHEFVKHTAAAVAQAITDAGPHRAEGRDAG